MARILAVLESGTIVDVILGAPEEYPDARDITDIQPQPGIGWSFTGTDPELGDQYAEPAPGPAPDYGTRITKLAFRQRIGTQALVGIELAAIHNPEGTPQQQQLAAMLRVMLEDVRVATFIDLARPDTRAGVQQLEAAGLLPTGKAAEILDTPVQPVEVPTL